MYYILFAMSYVFTSLLVHFINFLNYRLSHTPFHMQNENIMRVTDVSDEEHPYKNLSLSSFMPLIDDTPSLSVRADNLPPRWIVNNPLSHTHIYVHISCSPSTNFSPFISPHHQPINEI